MPRITPLPRSRFSPYVRVTDLIVRRMFGQSLEGMGVRAKAPGLVRAETGVERFFMSRRRTSPHRTLELVSLRTALEVGCSFCIDLGSYTAASKHGVSDEQLRGLASHSSAGCFTPAELAALDLAVAMAATPAVVSDELFARLGEHYTEPQIIELTAMAAWENYRARANAAFGLESQGFTSGGTCAVRAASPAGQESAA